MNEFWTAFIVSPPSPFVVRHAANARPLRRPRTTCICSVTNPTTSATSTTTIPAKTSITTAPTTTTSPSTTTTNTNVTTTTAPSNRNTTPVPLPNLTPTPLLASAPAPAPVPAPAAFLAPTLPAPSPPPPAPAPTPVPVHAAPQNRGRRGGHKSRRKTSQDIERDRQRKTKNVERCPIIVAVYNSVVLAETRHYDFVDGRFFFPKAAINWAVLQRSPHFKQINPIGKAALYDLVFTSHSSGRVVLRTRAAAMMFEGLRPVWRNMEGYTCFWKGVKIFKKPTDLQYRVAPGMKQIQPPVQTEDAPGSHAEKAGAVHAGEEERGDIGGAHLDGLETHDAMVQLTLAHDCSCDEQEQS